ncbi:MAG: hypothetical protein ACHQ6T_02685 [Myxococcota bacterium]
MRSIIATGLTLTLAAFLTASASADHGIISMGMGGGGEHKKPEIPRLMLSFHSMYGVDGGFIGDANPIRGVVGDEAPWEVAKSVRGFLTTSGHLFINVRGLVFKDDPSVPPELRGKNDEAQFRGLVSCLTEDGAATPTANVTSVGFPADANGNSVINAKLTLPNPCVAPVVFIMAGSEDKWFAVTGFEAPDN